jgi:hypothetical protein
MEAEKTTPVERMEQELIKINQKLAFIVGVILFFFLIGACGLLMQLTGGL